MPQSIKIALVGDYDAAFQPHQATSDALQHVADYLDVVVEPLWIPTPSLEPFPEAAMRDFVGLWCAPGSPFKSLEGVLNAIRFARESGRPFLGTCAGFQHLVIEYARNVLGIADARHAEYRPVDGALFITPLACAIAGTTLDVIVDPHSRAGQAYQEAVVQEQYYCTFGLNPACQQDLSDHGLSVVGVDRDGEARILEVRDHPFCLGTLFVPQMRSIPEHPHPLIIAFVQAALRFQEQSHAVLAAI
jgi:CTP synthase (UTP-ammonia lyase)